MWGGDEDVLVRWVPLCVKGTDYPQLRIPTIQYAEGFTSYIDTKYADSAIKVGTGYLRSIGSLMPYQTLGYPEASKARITYQVIDVPEMAVRRRLMAEVPIEYQHRVEQRYAAVVCKPLPAELEDMIREFLSSPGRRRAGVKGLSK